MVNVVRRRRGAAERRLPFGAAAEHYASMGWPVCAGAHPYRGTRASIEPGRACSCDRVGCPGARRAPGIPRLADAGHGGPQRDRELVGSPAGGERHTRHRPGF